MDVWRRNDGTVQCDQIWQIFTTLAKFWQSLAFFDGLFSICKICYLLWYIFAIVKSSLLDMAKCWTNNTAIWSYCNQQYKRTKEKSCFKMLPKVPTLSRYEVQPNKFIIVKVPDCTSGRRADFGWGRCHQRHWRLPCKTASCWEPTIP